MSQNNPDEGSAQELHLDRFVPDSSGVSEESSATVVIRCAAVYEAKEHPLVVPRQSGSMPPQQMLGAIAYCYAREIYEAEEIEARLLRDKRLRDSVHGELPTAHAIRRFRRLNCEAIQKTLEKAFRFVRRREKQRPTVPPPLPYRHVAGETTVSFVRREVATRVQNAIIRDREEC